MCKYRHSRFSRAYQFFCHNKSLLSTFQQYEAETMLLQWQNCKGVYRQHIQQVTSWTFWKCIILKTLGLSEVVLCSAWSALSTDLGSPIVSMYGIHRDNYGDIHRDKEVFMRGIHKNLCLQHLCFSLDSYLPSHSGHWWQRFYLS